MNISRYVNPADAKSGVTGYTSDVVSCRYCRRPSNTLRKDASGAERVFCSPECADSYDGYDADPLDSPHG